MLKNPFILALFSVIIMGFSIFLDFGSTSWVWFQRSGSIITVLGALMGVRSFFRIGIQGLGGATPYFEVGIVKSSKIESGKILVDVDPEEESKTARKEDRKDKFSMLIGIIHIIIGTIIWGYGDLLGFFFN